MNDFFSFFISDVQNLPSSSRNRGNDRRIRRSVCMSHYALTGLIFIYQNMVHFVKFKIFLFEKFFHSRVKFFEILGQRKYEHWSAIVRNCATSVSDEFSCWGRIVTEFLEFSVCQFCPTTFRRFQKKRFFFSW